MPTPCALTSVLGGLAIPLCVSLSRERDASLLSALCTLFSLSSRESLTSSRERGSQKLRRSSLSRELERDVLLASGQHSRSLPYTGV